MLEIYVPCIQALGSMAASQALPSIIAIAEDRFEARWVQSSAIAALGNFDDATSLGLLKRLADSDSERDYIRNAAVNALKRREAH